MLSPSFSFKSFISSFFSYPKWSNSIAVFHARLTPLQWIPELDSPIILSPDSTKVANLDKIELAMARTYFNMGNYAYSEGLDTVGDYLERKAQIINATSMSKKGFLAQLFVTQIKKEQKVKG